MWEPVFPHCLWEQTRDSLFYAKARKGDTNACGYNRGLCDGSRALRNGLELERQAEKVEIFFM